MELRDPNSTRKEVRRLSIGSYFELKCGSFLYSVLTASIMSLLVGATITLPSYALLEFTQYPDPTFQFDTLMADIFGVSVSKIEVRSCVYSSSSSQTIKFILSNKYVLIPFILLMIDSRTFLRILFINKPARTAATTRLSPTEYADAVLGFGARVNIRPA